MSNPFEDADGRYVVLVNDEGQHSLWPVWLPVPAGWVRGYGESTLADCTAYVDRTWVDLRPASLVRAMETDPA